MFFLKEAYATFWKAEDKGKYYAGSISTSEKDSREQGKYINSNWYAVFIGKAAEKVAGLSEKTKITITGGKVTNEKGTDGKSFCKVVIWDFEENESSGGNQSSKQGSLGFFPIDNDSDELPF